MIRASINMDPGIWEEWGRLSKAFGVSKGQMMALALEALPAILIAEAEKDLERLNENILQLETIAANESLSDSIRAAAKREIEKLEVEKTGYLFLQL